MSDSPTRAKDPKIIGESQKIFGFIKGASLVLVGVFLLSIFSKACNETRAKAEVEEKTRAEYIAAHPPTPVVPPEYPTSGSGHVTKEVGLKAYLDPMRTYLRPSRAVRYTFVEDPSLFFDETYIGGLEPNSTPHRKVWLSMPAGNYTVHALVDGKVYFRWWQ